MPVVPVVVEGTVATSVKFTLSVERETVKKCSVVELSIQLSVILPAPTAVNVRVVGGAGDGVRGVKMYAVPEAIAVALVLLATVSEAVGTADEVTLTKLVAGPDCKPTE